MPGFIDQPHPIEYFIVQEPRPIGRTIGTFLEQAIAEAIIDAFGRRYVFRGIATRNHAGRFDVKCLEPGEFIVPPGLIYRVVSERSSLWLGSRKHEV